MIRRGFTLLELMVALTVAMVVYAVGTQAMVALDIFRRISLARADLERQAALVVGWMERDLRASGVTGAGTGVRMPGAVASSALNPPLMSLTAPRTSALDPTMVGTRGFMILADVPRPDTPLDGISLVTDVVTGIGADELVVINELSGRCTADNAACGGRMGAVGNASADCASTDPNANGADACPWGFRKYVAGMPTTILYPSGNYQNATIQSFETGSAPYRIRLDAARAEDPSVPLPHARLMQLDRVGYRIEGQQLQRRQCWSAPQPEQASFQTFGGCSVGTNDTGWMALATDVAPETRIIFRDLQGAAVTNPALVHSAELNLRLRRVVRAGAGGSRPVEIQRVHRFLMRSMGR